jgi:hypothetical protein
VSDPIFTRLRALLGTTGVERDSQGVPRATPDTADALTLVCRLAHEEGWKIRVEGRTGDMASTRCPGRSQREHSWAGADRVGEPGRSGGHGPGRRIS